MLTSKEVIKNFKFHILIIFIVVVVAETIGLSYFLGIEATNGFILVTALHSLIITLIIVLKMKGHIHKGQTIFAIGIVLLSGGLLALFFSLSFKFQGVDVAQTFEMGFLGQGLAFGSIILGFISIVYGMRKAARDGTSIF